MIEAMGKASWPHNRIQMMADSWANLQEHPFRLSGAPFEQKSLLIYQAEQRRLWHIAITNPHSGYNLSSINEALLRDTKEHLFWDVLGRSSAIRGRTPASRKYLFPSI